MAKKQKSYLLLDLGSLVFQSTGRSNAQIHWEVIQELVDFLGQQFYDHYRE